MSDTFYLKVRYRGKLKNPKDVYPLIAETEDICRSNNWTHKIWDEDWSKPPSITTNFTKDALGFDGHAPLKGLTFGIGETEIIWLTFSPQGIIQSLFTLADPTFFLNDADFPWQRVKTSSNDAKTHIALCKLFRYLAGKYFEIFEVLDESNYWNHGDDAKFMEWMQHLTLDHRIMEEELDAIMEDESLGKEERRNKIHRIIKAFGEKYRVEK